MAAHAVFSPSGATMWTSCLAGLIHGVGVESADTEHARQGTAAHYLLESMIRFGDESLIPESYRDLIDDEMRGHIADVLDTLQQFAGPTGQIFPEQRVNFSAWVDCPTEMGFGTSDAFILVDDPVFGDTELQVHDLKYGMGILVTAEQNMQLMLYALGALLEFDWLAKVSRVRLVIHQPRREHLSEWDVSIDDLIRFSIKMRHIVQLYLRIVRDQLPVNEDLYSPSPAACQFCRIKETCPALMAEIYNGVVTDFDDLVMDIHLGTSTLRPQVDLTPEEIGNRVALLPLVQQWAVATQNEALRRLLDRKEVTGYKLVRSKGGRRKWSDEGDVAGALRIMRMPEDKVYSRKVLSPAQLEKVMKKAHPERWQSLQSFIVKKPGAPAMAPVSDPRPTLDTITADDFDEIGEE